MPKRYEEITELYRQAQREIINPATWQNFLKTACRNYRLPFDEQLLIFAQRHDAKTVLELERWNKKFNRWVNYGAKAIVVFDRKFTGKPKLKYYFDISDTHEGRTSRPVPIWTVYPKIVPEIIHTLEDRFGPLSKKENLAEALISATENVVEEYADTYYSELLNYVKNSSLSKMDELSLKIA